MVCPYCKKKMSDGYIPAIQSALMWIPDNEKVPLFKRQKAKSYYCGNCKIVITPVVEDY